MRRSARDRVISKHLRELASRRKELTLVLAGDSRLIQPTPGEAQLDRTDMDELELAERGLRDVLAPLWEISGTASGHVHAVEEAEVLVAARATMAVVAMALQQRAATEDLGADDVSRLAAATAAFRYLNATLAVIAGDDSEVLEGEDFLLQNEASAGAYGGGFGIQ